MRRRKSLESYSTASAKTKRDNAINEIRGRPVAARPAPKRDYTHNTSATSSSAAAAAVRASDVKITIVNDKATKPAKPAKPSKSAPLAYTTSAPSYADVAIVSRRTSGTAAAPVSVILPRAPKPSKPRPAQIVTKPAKASQALIQPNAQTFERQKEQVLKQKKAAIVVGKPIISSVVAVEPRKVSIESLLTVCNALY
jgi:hypothetical protein